MRGLLVALIIFGAIPFILQRPFVGLLVWSWIGYMNPHRLTYDFAYSFPWVMMIAVVTLGSLAVSRESKKIPLSTTSVLLFAFLVWTGIATVFAVEQASAWQAYEEFAKTMVMVFVTLMLVNTRERMHALVWVIAVSLGFYGIKGGIFTALGGGVSHVVGPPGSFIADNNAMALALCMTIPLMRYLQLHAKRKSVRLGLIGAMLLTGVAVLGTYSRGGLIGLLVVGGALLLKSRRRVAILAAVVVIGAVAWHFMPPQWTERMGTLHHAGETDSAETRIQSWEFAANVAIHRPLVAGGFNDYQNTALWEAYAPAGSKERAVHSIYFRTLGEQGFPGLILLLALLFTSWRNCQSVRKKTRHSPEDKWAYDLASMLQVSVAAYVVAGAALPMPYFDLSWQLMALTVLLKLHVMHVDEPSLGLRKIGRTAPSVRATKTRRVLPG